MKFLIFLLSFLPFSVTIAQKRQFKVHNLSLPSELKSGDNQFSGLSVAQGKLFLLSESRVQERSEAKLYAISLSDLEQKIGDTSYVLPYRKYHIDNLEILRDKINAAGQNYEGLEAIVVDSNKVLLSVETDTPSPNCYILAGQINDSSVILDTSLFTPIGKPQAADGAHIYNAGFEAVTKKDGLFYAFYEFNYFPSDNFVYGYDEQQLQNSRIPRKMKIKKIPFRVTDITHAGKKHFTAINYFFKGDGADAVYRTPANDRRNSKLIKGEAGYKNYCRLIDIKIKGSGFSWKPLWELPAAYQGYNWEGITAFKNGYFIVNDKYTSRPPFISTLLYLQKIR